MCPYRADLFENKEEEGYIVSLANSRIIVFISVVARL